MDSGRSFWDRTAKMYAPVQEKTNGRLYEKLAELTSPYIKGDMRVLELACGTGQMTLPLCSLASYWEATDFSEKMIKYMKRRAPENVKVALKDATCLPDGDGSFDMVVIANGLHIMPDPGKALDEIWRVLKPGGILIAPTFVSGKKMNRFRRWITMKMGFPEFHEWSQEGYRKVIEDAGFTALEDRLLPADPMPEVFLAAEKRSREV